MAIFNSKELDTLRIENKRLQTELEQSQYREEMSQSTITSLNQWAEKFREQLLAFEKENGEQAAEIKDLRRQLAAAEFEAHNERFQEFEQKMIEQAAEIKSLRRQLDDAKKKPRNERGAGRSRKTTPEQVNFILSLRTEGKSYSFIANALTEKYGGKWNKTNVRNAIITSERI